MFLHFRTCWRDRTVPCIVCFFVFATLICLLPSNIIAQNFTVYNKKTADLSDDKLKIGLGGGLSLNRFTKDQPQTGFNTGFVFGALVNYKIYKPLSLQVEANILQQGGQLIRFKDDTRLGLPEGFENQNVKNSSYHLNSIEVPVLLNYTFNIKQTWKPALYAGGSYIHTYNVTENYQKTGNLLPGEDIIATVNGSQNVTGVFKNNRLNFIIGANVKLPLYAKLKLLLDFRYLSGLTAARNNYSYMEKIGFGSSVFTNSFISRVGLILPLASNASH